MSLSEEDRFNLELLKLLVQVAWQDETVAYREAEMIHGLGRSWSVPELALQDLLKHLREGIQLPPPDLGLLRQRPDDTLEAVRALVAVDGQLADSEQDLLEQVKALLAQ